MLSNILYLKDFFGKSDPYLEFSKAREDGSFVLLHRTEVLFHLNHLHAVACDQEVALI